MNILFIALLDIRSVYEHNIYSDLLREFAKRGHNICIVSPIERRNKRKTYLINEDKVTILKLRTGNIQKTNIIEKGISTVFIEYQIQNGIKKYFNNIKFDLILYSTPPITLIKPIMYVKKRDNAVTYLMLKDIFPQNAVDLGMMSRSGPKSIIYRYFRNKEERLYRVSDRIGCMSEANAAYVLNHNPKVRERNDRAKKKTGRSIVEVCPNCIEPRDTSIGKEEREEVRKRYHIPLDKTVFVYGGNLGKPQGIDFMLKCMHSQRKNDKAFFLIVGNGTEYGRIERYVEKYKPGNIALHQWLPKEEYDKVIAACDVGMIFLDHRFTIPNFPSRLLGYMSAKLPVLAVTDTATDIGKVIVEGGFGWWCESDDTNKFIERINCVLDSDIHVLGENGYEYLKQNYDVEDSVKGILNHLGS